MTYGPSLQTHFNARVDLPTLEEIRGFGFRWARIDCQASDLDTMLGMIDDVDRAALLPLPIVYDLERLDLLGVNPAVTDVEWGNEPDGDILPSTYRDQLELACERAQYYHLNLWAPAISNLDRDSLFWLERVRGVGWPAGLHGISVHRYGDGTFEHPHDGFSSRDDEVQALLALCDGRPFIVTEFGYPSAPVSIFSKRPKRTKYLQPGLYLTEAQQAERIAQEWDFWRAYTDRPFLYQINDGIHADESYGIRRCLPDGTLTDWKPAAYGVPQEEPLAMPTIAITNATLFGPRPITGWLTGEFDGVSVKLTEALAGGPYLSIQPTADYQGRPSGGGAYESFTKQGSDLVCHYHVDGVEVVHVVPFKDLP